MQCEACTQVLALLLQDSEMSLKLPGFRFLLCTKEAPIDPHGSEV